jgi:phosphoglycerol transferase
MIGYDLTRLPDDAPGRAIMQYDANQAYMEGERVVVLQPDLPATHSTWDGHILTPCAADPALERRARAHALLPSLLYREQVYHTP